MAEKSLAELEGFPPLKEIKSISVEEFKEFIKDDKYQNIRNFLYQAFDDCSNLATQLCYEMPQYVPLHGDNNENERLIDTLDDIIDYSEKCKNLLERAYHD